MIDWYNTQEIIENLEEIFPNEDIEELTREDLKERLMELAHYEVIPDLTSDQLDEILDGWKNLRDDL